MRYPVNVRDITLPQEYSTLNGMRKRGRTLLCTAIDPRGKLYQRIHETEPPTLDGWTELDRQNERDYDMQVRRCMRRWRRWSRHNDPKLGYPLCVYAQMHTHEMLYGDEKVRGR